MRRGFTRLAGEFGVKVPSGRSGFTSNRVGYLFALIFSHVRDRHWWVTDFQYLLTREKSDGVNPGNRWNYDFAYLYRLLPWRGFEGKNLFLVAELNGEFATRSRSFGVPFADSGGSILFFSPGVQFSAQPAYCAGVCRPASYSPRPPWIAAQADVYIHNGHPIPLLRRTNFVKSRFGIHHSSVGNSLLDLLRNLGPAAGAGL